MSHRHLTVDDREVLALLRQQGLSQIRIAREIGCTQSTVSRELRRNAAPHGYRAIAAHRRARDRRRRANESRPTKMSDSAIAAYVREGLKKTWSPDEIAGRMRVDYPRDPGMRISYETIYQWIWANKAQGALWHTYLRQGHRKRKRRTRRAQDRRGKIPNRTFIDQRPPSVDARRYFGDWESDTLVGAGRKGAICTHVERRSQYLILANAGSRNWRKVVSKSRAAFRRHEGIVPLPRRTMTVDNGQEFWGHKALSKALAVSVYFARPHHPWERGLNEQVNGLIRQFLPKGRDLRPVSLRELKRIEGLLNNRPRKKLGYRTPLEVLSRRRLYASRT